MTPLFAIVFASGGAILALELLASRVMTPYFGVSLYIWTGILSITLVSLALGYWAGGKLAARMPGAGAAARLTQIFALMPALAAIAIVAACMVYPFLFASLAGLSLVLGAFAACLILLFLPLVVTSAMNPLLVAITLQRAEGRSGDAGAGKVFFISTIGSVAGVLVTAFGLIPYLSNFTAMLVVALMLALLSLVAAALALPRSRRAAVRATALAGVFAALVLLWQADAYTGRLGPAHFGNLDFKVEASYGSLFGTVKILKSVTPDAEGRFVRVYFQDGMVQNTVESTGRSLSFYTHALEALAYAYRPQLRSALILGLGAGVVPNKLAARGVDVEVVEIDPVALTIAERFFGFARSRARVHLADARTFVRTCPRPFDVVVVDLFHGDGTPEYLVTREFFGDLKRCLSPQGVAVFNTFADLEHPEVYANLLATLHAELPHIVLYRPGWKAAQVNGFIVAGKAPLAQPGRVTLADVPAHQDAPLWEMLARPMPLEEKDLAGGRIITDAHNVAAHAIAVSQIDYRRAVVRALPPAFLLN
ncbi:MAG: fused MFS/spermidine synthase [Betaproteobacteria bacterium]|nr:fused MFS/spermidine synthase [Betaproteobacteria bacterium]